MLKRVRVRATYANVVSTLCLFIILGGGAYAASKITAKDISRGAVKSKAVKDGGIKAVDVKDNSLTGIKIADGGIGGADLGNGSVGTAELAAGLHEPLTLLNGGENDCVWTDIAGPGGFEGAAPVAYRRSLDGEVSLEGGANPVAGPGGDAMCDGGGAEGTEDSMVLRLPATATPANSQVFVSPSGASVIVIAGVNGLGLGAAALPPGTVSTAVSGPAFLNQISFLAADAPASPLPLKGPDRVSRATLRQLVD